MLEQSETPFIAHVFVCTNDRGGARKSCADYKSKLIKAELKKIANDKGWRGKVRVSTSGCLGVCDKGPNVMIYPQKIWFSEVDHNHLDEIVSTIERTLDDG